MPHPFTLPALSVLALVGSGVGVFIGRSAVSEINPVYFSEAESRFHADLSPNPPSMDPPRISDAAALSAAEMEQALGTGCVGCRSTGEAMYPVHDTDENGYRPTWAVVDERSVSPDPRAAEIVSEAEAAERARRDQEHAEAVAQVHRYTSYAVASDPSADPVHASPEAIEPTELASAEVPLQE